MPTIIQDYDYPALLKSFSWDGIANQQAIKNGHIIFLLTETSEGKFKTLETAATIWRYVQSKGYENLSSEDCIRLKIRRLLSRLQSLRKKIQMNWIKIVSLFSEDFCPGTGTTRNNKRTQAEIVCPLTPKKTKSENKENHNQLSPPCSHVFEKSKFLKCIADLKQKLQDAKKTIRHLEKKQEFYQLKMKLKRKDQILNKCRNEKGVAVTSLFRLKKQTDALKIKKSTLLKDKRLLQKRVTRLQQTNARQSSMLKEAQGKIGCLMDKLAEVIGLSKQAEEDRCNSATKIHSPPVRKCLYYCLEDQVPIDKAGVLINYILQELASTSLCKVPAPSTIAQMAYEMGIVSDLQIAEALVSSSADVATIAWDATTIDGSHFNEINISLQKRTYTIEIGKLPGGKTLDYAHHLENNIKNMATLYSLFTITQQQLVLHGMQQAISSTLSDRAPVNSCVNKQLGEMLCKPLIELHCNLHPLDGIASEAKKILKQFDEKYKSQKSKNEIFGTEGKAANLVYAVSKLKYKMNSGDPVGFKTFLRLSDVNPGMIVRYVGNRLHILFHSAGVIVHVKDVLLMFLKKYCNDNAFRAALLQDLQQPVIITELRVLGLFGKLLTGPWMKIFYQNKDKKAHLQMAKVMQKCLHNLTTFTSNPRSLVTNSVDCFGVNLDSGDHILASLRSVEPDELFDNIAKALAEGFLVVLNRQLEDYVKGPLSRPSPSLFKMTASAPLHNMHSERALGMFDAHCSRSKNATCGFMDGKVKFKINDTMAWLKSKTVDEQNKIIIFAIRQAAKKRKKLQAIEKNIQQAIALRQKLMAQKRDKKNRKMIENDIKNDRTLNSFQEITEEQRSVCLSLLDSSQTGSFVDRTLHHFWENESNVEMFIGTVIKVKSDFLWIKYLGEETLTKLSLYELVADIILGDASFTM